MAGYNAEHWRKVLAAGKAALTERLSKINEQLYDAHGYVGGPLTVDCGEPFGKAFIGFDGQTDEEFANAMLRLKMELPLRRVRDGVVSPALDPDIDVSSITRDIARGG